MISTESDTVEWWCPICAMQTLHQEVSFLETRAEGQARSFLQLAEEHTQLVVEHEELKEENAQLKLRVESLDARCTSMGDEGNNSQ